MDNYFQTKWKRVRSATSEVDLTFLVLRVLSLAGGIFWLLTVPLAPSEKAILTNALVLFGLYSLACYYLIFMEPAWLRGVYHTSMFLQQTTTSITLDQIRVLVALYLVE